MVPPLVSVVIPTYNRGPETLGRAIRSVLAQEVPSEVIVVDDGSPNPPTEVQQQFRGEERIRWVLQEDNRGGGAARNAGIERASAPLLALLDSDDWWLPQKLARNLAFVERAKLEGDSWVLYSRIKTLTTEGERVSSPRPRGDGTSLPEFLFVERGQIQTSSILLPTPLARRARFDPSLKRLQDWDFYLRLDRLGARFVFQPEVLTVYDARDQDDRISSNLDSDFLLDWIEARRDLISSRAYAGFLANKVAPEMVQQGRRLDAVRLLLQGVAARAVPTRALAIELLRLGLPEGAFAMLRRSRSRG